MPYIIDGHNLIPKVPGLSLRAVDDELQLIELLQDFCRRQRKQVEVFFDRSPPGQSGTRKFGAVTAHFVRQGGTADDAIATRLQRLGATARNWTVVSSDQRVQASARLAGAQAQDSAVFARQLIPTGSQPVGGETHVGKNPRGKTRDSSSSMSEKELDEWMRLFGAEDDE